MSRIEDKPGRIGKRLPIGLLLFAIVFGIWWGIPAYRRASADAAVRDLCAKDGGMKVYETVKLPAEWFDGYGNVKFGTRWSPPLNRSAEKSDDFFYTWETTWIVPETSFGGLAMWRDHQKLFRAADQKLLGEVIGYSRRGGDPIGLWQPSHFGCPHEADITVLLRRTFAKQEDAINRQQLSVNNSFRTD